jgi:hypothetical protein
MSTCNIALYGDTGRYPLHLYVVISMLKYIYHVQNADKNSLVKEIFMDQVKLYQLGFDSHISRILHNLKLYGIDLTLSNGEIEILDPILISKYKKMILETYRNNWTDELHSGKYPSLRTYKLFKPYFICEPYLLFITCCCVMNFIFYCFLLTVYTYSEINN